MAVEKGRATRPDLKIGICGEQGGDPASVEFCFASGPELRELLALPRAHRPPGRRPGRHQGEEEVDAERPKTNRPSPATAGKGPTSGPDGFPIGAACVWAGVLQYAAVGLFKCAAPGPNGKRDRRQEYPGVSFDRICS